MLIPTNRIVFAPDDPPSSGNPPPAGDPPAPPAPPATPAPVPTKSTWETWLEKQPEDVRKMYGENVSGLTSALDKERQQRKENEKQLKRLAELEADEQKRRDAAKTELEKAQDALKAAEDRAKKLELKDLQRQAAEKVGLPIALAERLKGETLEELKLDAEALSKTLPQKQAPGLQPTKPGGNADGSGETDEQRRRRLLG